MLNPRQRAVIDALAPSGAAPDLPGGLESGFEDFHVRFRQTALLSTRVGFSLALWSAAWLSPLLIGKLPPITNLSDDDRVRALESMGKSRLYLMRQLSLLLKAVFSFHYGAHAQVRRAIQHTL